MAARNTAVFGIYAGRDLVEDGIANLKSAGFRNTDIAMMLPENEGTRELAFARRTKLPEGAALGWLLGAIIGGLLGWLAGSGFMGIPGTAELARAGVVPSILTGIGALGLAGACIGFLAGIAVPEYEAKRYDGRIRRGGILMSVHCDTPELVKQARTVLRHTGALSIASVTEARADFGKRLAPPRAHTAGRGSGSPVS